LTFAFGCGCVGAVGPLLTAAFVELATEFDVTLSKFASSVNGSLIMCIAGGSIICNSLAVVYGKRPVYLITSVLLMVTCFWGAGSNSLASLTASRCIQGFAMAPMEALIPASIGDVWFVHERGFRSAIFNLGVLGGINLASPIAGTIIQNNGWKVAFWIMGAFFAVQTILVFFFMPESAYHRADVLNLDLGSHENINEALKYEKEHEHRTEKTSEDNVTDAQGNDIPTGTRSPSVTSEKQSYLRELLPYSGYNSHDNLIKIMIRPFSLLASPVVLWATLLFTTCISWLVGISITISQIFSAPPYNFTVSQVGLTNLSSFVASLLATLIAEPLTDGIARFMARKNGGVYEPEFRLPILISYLVFTTVGFFAWGQAAQNQAPWPVAVIVCLGLINFGIQLGTTGIVAYVVDTHRDKASEAFATMNFVKNTFAFGLTFYINDWIANQGVRQTFFVIGGLTLAASLTTIPMYIYGKRSRSWIHRSKIVR